MQYYKIIAADRTTLPLRPRERGALLHDDTPRVSLSDLRRHYRGTKSDEEWYGDWGSALIYRPLSFPIALWLIRCSVGPNAVTLAGLVLALALPVVALAGGYVALSIAAFFFCINDCVDGNIARATGTASRRGHYLDCVTDIAFRVSFYAAIGMLAGSLWGAFGLLAATLAVVARLCRVYAETLTGRRVYDKEPEAPARAGRWSDYIFPFASGIDSLLPLFVFAAGYWATMDWVIGWLMVYSTLDLLYTNYEIVRRLG
jgi:phosphatidylglycerophosphate synthase